MPKYDLILKGGRVLDPASGTDGVRDVAVRRGRIEAVEPDLDPALAPDVIDLVSDGAPGGALKLRSSAKAAQDGRGRSLQRPLWLMPGMIDTHVHVAGEFPGISDCSPGLRMAVEAGATTALDMGGTMDRLIGGVRRRGCGLTVGSLLMLKPGATLPGDDPSPRVVRRVLGDALKAGSLGMKLWGGYHPFSPEVTADVIAACNDEQVYAAYHVGTKATGSRLDGLRELPSLLGANGRAHVAHVNAYCRGSLLPPADEIREALDILRTLSGGPSGSENLPDRRRQVVSEVHLAIPNFTLGRCDAQGRVAADVARNCLKLRGFEPTADGVRFAIRDGYARVVTDRDGRLELVPGEAGVAIFDELDTNVPLSFPVNRPDTAFQLAVARNAGPARAGASRPAEGDHPAAVQPEVVEGVNRHPASFTVDAIASDAGVFPRNVNIEQAFQIVRFGGLTPLEMATRLSYNPSMMLGMVNKGRIAPGADADFTVIDPAAGRAVLGISAGRTIMRHGAALENEGGRLLVTAAGVSSAKASGLPYEVVDFSRSLLYRDP